MRPPLLELVPSVLVPTLPVLVSKPPDPMLELWELVLELCELVLAPPPLVLELPGEVGVAGSQQMMKTDASAHH